MLDALVVAPHPDDAELGMGGTIIRLLQQGWKVGIVDLTSGEPTPLGSVDRRATETLAANSVMGSPWRKNLGLPNRSLEANLASRRELAAVFRRVQTPSALRAVLGGCPSRPHCGDEAGRGRPVLEQAIQVGYPRHALSPGAHSLLL